MRRAPAPAPRSHPDAPSAGRDEAAAAARLPAASRGRRLASSWPLSLTAPLVACGIAVLVAGTISSEYWLTLLTQAGAYGLAVVGLGFFIGRAGQVSFGHNAFVAVGAYATGLGTTRWGLAPVVAAMLGMVLAAGLAAVVGIPALRLRGHYLALATFALGSGVVALATSSSWTGGQSGVQGIAPLTILGLDLSSVADTYYAVWVVAIVGAVVAWRLGRLRFGMALRTLAVDEDTARSAGIAPLRYKVVAFAISAAYCALGGSLLAHSTLFINPDSFGFDGLINLYLAMLVGGVGTIWGSLLGAVVVVTLPQYLPGLQDIRPAVFAVVLLAVLISRPTGLLAALGPQTVDRLRKAVPLGRLGRRVLQASPHEMTGA